MQINQSNEVMEELQRVFRIQIAGLNGLLERLGTDAVEVVCRLMDLDGKLVVTGVGKSGLIGQKLAATFSSTGTTACFMNAAEALHGDLGMVASGDAVLMISNSGATPELVQMLPSLRHCGVTLYGIFGNSASPLARECDIALDARVDEEACHLGLAPTTSSTAALVLGDAIACSLMKIRGFSSQQFAINHPGGTIGRRLLFRAKDIMHQGSEIPRVKPSVDLREAAIEMTRSPLGAVCVCDNDNRLLGILTDGDFRRRLIHSDDLGIAVEECMTAEPACGVPDDTLDRLIQIMESPKRKVYSLPIIDDERRLLGFVRMHDVLSGD